LILDFEFDQHLESHKHVINIIMGFRDMGCYTSSGGLGLKDKMIFAYQMHCAMTT
jgi:hypothetical protein